MNLTDEEIRAITPSIYFEAMSFTRSEKMNELLPRGHARLAILRAVLGKIIDSGLHVMSPEEQRAVGL